VRLDGDERTMSDRRLHTYTPGSAYVRKVCEKSVVKMKSRAMDRCRDGISCFDDLHIAWRFPGTGAWKWEWGF
jgi:hypothetical protein